MSASRDTMGEESAAAASVAAGAGLTSSARRTVVPTALTNGIHGLYAIRK